ncbi:MAG: mitochondrial fission protein ELM1 [Rickettsiales bacterium]|jgi:mitochondrial fission protein ELM1
MSNNPVEKHETIWVLKDDRAGNYSQAIGLSEALASGNKSEVHIKEISYNSFSKLPNFLKINGLWGVDSKSRLEILNLCSENDQFPTIIISAGRKTAPLAAYLKKKYKSKAIQIMNPNLNFKKFDFVILPHHDKKSKETNVIRIFGALTRISDDILKKEYKKFADILEKIDSPRIVLLVGGSSKKGNFTNEIAINLGKIVSQAVNQMRGNLLVLNSRRTGEEITEILDKNLNCSKVFFKWQKENWENPYFAALKAADFIIATGDSISMCCEISSLGKPIYIFNPIEICSSKHLKFHQNMFDGGFSRKFDENNHILKKFDSNKLQETTRVAKLLLTKRL